MGQILHSVMCNCGVAPVIGDEFVGWGCWGGCGCWLGGLGCRRFPPNQRSPPSGRKVVGREAGVLWGGGCGWGWSGSGVCTVGRTTVGTTDKILHDMTTIMWPQGLGMLCGCWLWVGGPALPAQPALPAERTQGRRTRDRGVGCECGWVCSWIVVCGPPRTAHKINCYEHVLGIQPVIKCRRKPARS
jgi:hypothetical protein